MPHRTSIKPIPGLLFLVVLAGCGPERIETVEPALEPEPAMEPVPQSQAEPVVNPVPAPEVVV